MAEWLKAHDSKSCGQKCLGGSNPLASAMLLKRRCPVAKTKKCKYLFVTGGVLSGVGKGITAASMGAILKAKGYRVTMQKCDPYLNVDAGLLNPVEHGECYVTHDGVETDLDLGHYERFLDFEKFLYFSLLS